MISALRIGLLVSDAGSWLGGVSYVENLAQAIATLPEAERPRLMLVCTGRTRAYLERFEAIYSLIDQIICVNQADGGWEDTAGENPIGFTGITCPTDADLFQYIDFLYPCLQALTPEAASYPHAAWIPDFQHIDYPQFFTSEEIQERNALFSEISLRSPLLVLSSHHTASKFRSLYPTSPTIERILPFHTLPRPEWYGQDAAAVARRYDLPDRFLICNNQFWQHKGHNTLFEAMRLLRDMGVEVAVVCTGDTSDYRNAEYFQQLKQQIQTLGLTEQVYILGSIPRPDQIQLIRQSLAVVQPSRYEGWSTVVEEARALGKPIFLSDFSVHLEQNPDRGFYFPQQDSQALATILHQILPTLPTGVEEDAETLAQNQALQRATAFARAFCQIALEAQFIFSRQPQGISPQLWNLLSSPLPLEAMTSDFPAPLSSPSAQSPPSEAEPAAPDSTQIEQLRSQLQQTQTELTQAQADLREVFTLRRNLKQATEQAKVFKASAEERLGLADHLKRVAEERAQVIEQLEQVAHERLLLINDLTQVADERLAAQIELETKVKELTRSSQRSEKQASRLQDKVTALQQSLEESKQQVSELEQKLAYLSSFQGISRTLRKKLLRRVGVEK